MTIGYEGMDLKSFVGELKANGVTTIVDVRELPLSRKKGFSKSALGKTLEEHGIGYKHVAALGCPREVRKDYYVDRNWTRYKKRFNAYLQTQEHELKKLFQLAKDEACCLICFESDYQFCHRSLITDALAAAHSIRIKHLKIRKSGPTANLRLVAA